MYRTLKTGKNNTRCCVVKDENLHKWILVLILLTTHMGGGWTRVNKVKGISYMAMGAH